ncbi:10244_t:CDS:2 [Entrophospora sp. SA101]|nr:10244_t:CDS:2 [Entrophospora sp. SA101]
MLSDQAICLRIKHQKTTIFLTAISTDSLLKIKKKIIKILEETENQVPSKIRLYKYQNNSGPTLALDIDYETIEGLNIKDNEVLILCFWDKIINDWESINIEQPEPLTYESDVEPEEDFEDGINKIVEENSSSNNNKSDKLFAIFTILHTNSNK